VIDKEQGRGSDFLVVDTRLRPNCLIESVDTGHTEPWKRHDAMRHLEQDQGCFHCGVNGGYLPNSNPNMIQTVSVIWPKRVLSPL
jgi:hypothetical protein